MSVEWSSPCEVTYSGTSKQRTCQVTTLLAFLERLWPFLCKLVKFVFLTYIIPLHGYLRFKGECVDD